MANTVTVYGPYTKQTWTNGSSPLNATRLGVLETQASTAINSFNADMIGAGFVFSGMVCSKNGTTATQLDVTSGRAYLIMTDGYPALVTATASTAGQFSTSTPSTTYYLFLKNDGTYQWGTSSSQPTNSLWLCQVATDGSGNISTVTDKRVVNFTLFPSPAGRLQFLSSNAYVDASGNFLSAGNYYLGSTSAGFSLDGANNAIVMLNDRTAAAQTIAFQVYNGSSAVNVFAIGSSYFGTPTVMSNAGVFTSIAGQATAGSFGTAPIVGIVTEQTVADTSVHNYTLCTVPATGMYLVVGQFYIAGGTSRKYLFSCSFTQGHSGNATSHAFVSQNNTGGLLWDASGSGDSASTGDSQGCIMPIYLQTGTTLTLRFQDSGWTTGNNKVGGMVFRLW